MAVNWTGINTDQELELFQGASPAQICVGPDSQSWFLPVDLLCHVSKFFRAALKGGFDEAKEKRVMLKEENPSVFRVFVLWLYKGRLFDKCTASELHEYTVQAWILGDKLGAPAFQNCLTQELMVSEDSVLYDPKVVRYIYDNSVESSLLRKMTVDMTAYEYGSFEPGEAWDSLCFAGGDFMVDLLRALHHRWEAEAYPPPWEELAKYILTI